VDAVIRVFGRTQPTRQPTEVATSIRVTPAGPGQSRPFSITLGPHPLHAAPLTSGFASATAASSSEDGTRFAASFSDQRRRLASRFGIDRWAETWLAPHRRVHTRITLATSLPSPVLLHDRPVHPAAARLLHPNASRSGRRAPDITHPRDGSNSFERAAVARGERTEPAQADSRCVVPRCHRAVEDCDEARRAPAPRSRTVNNLRPCCCSRTP